MSCAVDEVAESLGCAVDCAVDRAVKAVKDKKRSFRAYQALIQAAGDPDLPHIDVFTLNHDRLLEATLDHADVQCRVVMPDAPEEDSVPGEGRSAKVHIYKLHGCVSWEFRNEDDRHLANRRFVHRHPGMPRAPSPAILVGRFNKMLQQANNPAFFDLLRRFAARLAETQFLVVSGYSFSDKGINTFLFDWLGWKDIGRRMLVVHADPEKLMAGARPMAGGNSEWPELSDRGNLKKAFELEIAHPIRKWFHEAAWDPDLKKWLSE